ncbi:MAG: sigma-54 dependent transcriptional regulator [Vicinamibacterales bacterium]
MTLVRPKTVLVVDDDQGMRETLTAILRRDYRVVTAPSAEAGLEFLHREPVDLMLLDVRLPGMSGLDLLKIVKEHYSLTEVVMISSINEVETAVQAMKDGAYHYITKDFEYDALRSLLHNASERQDLSRQVMTLRTQVAEEQEQQDLVGPGLAMRELLELVHKVAKTSATILIQGESGTGKELLARRIHRESDRRDAPFVPVNMAAIPHELVESTLFGHEKGAFTGAVRQQIGRFEMAGRGTLFLDEIGDLRLDLQAKLLRAIQEDEIERVGGSRPIKTDFRLIVATNVDLDQAAREGRFREDLLYRIKVVPIRLPPLRERPDDLPELVDLFIRRYAKRFRKRVAGISTSTLKLLSGYHWPGNVRELENLVERLVAINDKGWISDEDIPVEYHLAQLDAKTTKSDNLLEEALNTFERTYLLQALEKQDWNVSATARHLGIPLSTLKHKMGRLDIREIARRLRGQ